MFANLHSFNETKTGFLLIGLPKQLSRFTNAALFMPSNVMIIPFVSAHNFGVIFDSSHTMFDHIASVSKSCYMSNHNLRRIRNTLDSTTAEHIAASVIHSKVDYCNPLFLNLPHSQLHLQLILNFAARAVSKTLDSPIFHQFSNRYTQWRYQDFVKGANQGVWRIEVPSGVWGSAPYLGDSDFLVFW